MAHQETIKAEKRSGLGKRAAYHLRKAGKIPGNIYGHQQAPQPISVLKDDLLAAIKTGTRVLDVDLGGKPETTLLRELQWDHLGISIYHVDLQRVDPNEKLTVEVHVELKGTAIGVLGGGVLDHSLRTITIECPVVQIPDNIVVKIADLEVGQAIHVRDLEVPPNSRFLNSPEAIVVRVAKAVDVAATLTGLEAPAQPEVIGRKAADEEEAAEKK